jgi:hypothetical protein
MIFDLGRDLLGNLKGDLCLDLFLDLGPVRMSLSSVFRTLILSLELESPW